VLQVQRGRTGNQTEQKRAVFGLWQFPEMQNHYQYQGSAASKAVAGRRGLAYQDVGRSRPNPRKKKTKKGKKDQKIML
jgi:hypothetical protein